LVEPVRATLRPSPFWPVNLDIRSHKDVVYHTVEEVKDAFGAAGMTLELIERLRRREQEQQLKTIEHVPVG
jgi:hypothetical protein